MRWGLNIWITSKVVWAVPSNFPKEGLGFGGDEREPNCFMWERRTKGGEAEKKKDTGKMRHWKRGSREWCPVRTIVNDKNF